MPRTTEERIARLEPKIEAISPDDPIAEAARKVLLSEFVRMLSLEAGSRTGEDIENVHRMRVTIRRMRSAFRLLSEYFDAKAVRPYDRGLRDIMRALGHVRDLDVMIHDLETFKADQPAEMAAALDAVIALLDARRIPARADLNAALDSKDYRRFIKSFGQFLTTPGAGARDLSGAGVVPYQLRHVLPLIIYEHLVAVRAYETVLAEADAETLHQLRIEFKRLRYILSLFGDVLGGSLAEFITELKIIQDHLGRLNDIQTARPRLEGLMHQLSPEQVAVLEIYLEGLEAEQPALMAAMPEVWRRFNRRTVQRKLANAVVAL